MSCPPATCAQPKRRPAAVSPAKRKKRALPAWAAEKFYTIEQAVERLGFTRQYIYRLIGVELVGGSEVINGLATVTKKSVDDYLKRKLRVKGTR
jgi:hypothetical protein